MNAVTKGYLVILRGAVSAFVLLGALVAYLEMTNHPNFFIFKYQKAKLESPRGQIHTIFVGDSSLGHSINARMFSELSGQESLNLALSGRYTLLGSLNMVRRTLAYTRPRNVVIMHTTDTLSRNVELSAYFLTIPSLSSDPLERSMRAARDHFIFWLQAGTTDTWKRITLRPQRIISDDYVLQRPERRIVKTDATLPSRVLP